MNGSIVLLFLGCAVAGRVQAQSPADSSAPTPVPVVADQPLSSPRAASDSAPPSSLIPSDSSVAPPVAVPSLRAAQKSKAAAPTPVVGAGSWQLGLDFAELSDSGLLNQRHFSQTSDQTILCCLDVAWLPAATGSGRIRAGAFGNLGGWHQDLSDGSSATVVDVSLGGSLLGWMPIDSSRRAWTRLDLGVSNLLVHRHSTGMDWGLAGGIRAGIAFPVWSRTGFLGVGFDFRDYWHLDVHQVPALTLFIGEWF